MKLNLLPNLTLNGGPFDEVVVESLATLTKAILEEAKEGHNVQENVRVYLRNHECTKRGNSKSIPFTFLVEPGPADRSGDQPAVYFVFNDEKFIQNGHLSLAAHGAACSNEHLFRLLFGHLVPKPDHEFATV